MLTKKNFHKTIRKSIRPEDKAVFIGKRLIFLVLLLLIVFSRGSILKAQNPEWMNFINGNYVTSMVMEGNNLWIGTNGGLVKLNISTGKEVFFNKANSGLPDNYVNCIAVDSSGNKWIGTQDGLAKYDGTNWTVYDTSNSGLPANGIRCLAVDESGNIWIGGPYIKGTFKITSTKGSFKITSIIGGLVKYDGTNWTDYNTSNSGLPDNYVSCLATDGGGNIWVGTEYDGLAKYDGTKPEGTGWTVYNKSNSGLPDNYVNCIATDGSGNIWIGTEEDGLAKYNGTNWTVYYSSNYGLPNNHVYCIAIDGKENIWTGTYNGLAKYDGVNWTVYDTSNSGLPFNYVSCLVVDEIGNTWIGTCDGFNGELAKYDGTNPEGTGWTFYNTSNSGLLGNIVLCLAIDGSGDKWIGTYYGGLVKYEGTNWTVYNTNNSDWPVQDNAVHYLVVDGSRNIWIETEDGLVKYDGTNWTVYNASNSGLPSNGVSCLAADESGNVWIGTYDGGLAEYDGTNPEGTGWTVYNASNSGLPSNVVSCLAVDESGNIWIGSDGLTKYDGINWTVYDSSNSGLPANVIRCLAVDESGNVWIGTYGGGLAEYDGTNPEGTGWTVYNTSNSGLPSNGVSCLAADESGNVWIGTYDGGLAEYDGTNWTVYNASNSGLPSNYVFSLAVDGSGNKWIGTENGLAVFNEGGIVSSIKPEDNKVIYPDKFILSQNYPNPFNPSTTIKYSIPKQSYVTLKVYDILGCEVATLVNEEKPAGNYEVEFFTVSGIRNLASGIYFYQIKAGDYVSTKKMILVK